MTEEKPLTRQEVVDIVVEKMKAVSARTSMSQAPNQVFQMQGIIKRATTLTQNQWVDAWTGLNVAAGAGSTKKNVRIYSVTLDQATANEDLEVRITADDYDGTATQTVVAATNYEIQVDVDPDTTTLVIFSTSLLGDRRAFLIEARSIKITYRKTSAAGANNTSIKIIYAQIP